MPSSLRTASSASRPEPYSMKLHRTERASGYRRGPRRDLGGKNAPEGRVALVDVGKGDVTGRTSKVLEVLRVFEEPYGAIRREVAVERRTTTRVTTATTISNEFPSEDDDAFVSSPYTNIASRPDPHIQSNRSDVCQRRRGGSRPSAATKRVRVPLKGPPTLRARRVP